MFALILTIIAVVIAAALALTTLYYGGSAFSSAGSQASAARLVNEGQQISAAATLYSATHDSYANDISVLVSTDHLKTVPQPGWQTYRDTAVMTAIDQSNCIKLNKTNNVDGIPQCTDPAIAGKTVCCEQAPTN